TFDATKAKSAPATTMIIVMTMILTYNVRMIGIPRYRRYISLWIVMEAPEWSRSIFDYEFISQSTCCLNGKTVFFITEALAKSFDMYIHCTLLPCVTSTPYK